MSEDFRNQLFLSTNAAGAANTATGSNINSNVNTDSTSLSSAYSYSFSIDNLPNSSMNSSTSPLTSLLCTSSANSWIKMSQCEEFIGPKRSKHTMVAYGNSLYVFGGDNGKQMLNDLIMYDCSNNSWGRALNLNNSPPTPRYHHTAVVYNNSMFVFGGYTGDINSNSNLCNKNDLYEYRFTTGSWTLWNVECAPAARAAHSAVVYDHKLWIFAGYDGNCRLNDMWSIQLNVPQNMPKTWVEVEQSGDQPSTVCNFPLVVVQDAMYLFSGQSGAKTSNLLFKFDFKTLSWTKLSSNYILRGTSQSPERRSGHIMIAHDNHLYVYGGVLGNSFFHEIYSFDLETNTWELITMDPKSPIPFGRSFLAAAVQNENLYVFGGNGDQNVRSNELFRFKLPNQPKSTLRNDFYKLLKKELFCDLKFICANNFVIKAHCAIVACRSSYCRQLIKIAKEKLPSASGNNNCLKSQAHSGSQPVQSQASDRIGKTSTVSAAAVAAVAASETIVKSSPFNLNNDEFIEIKINNENPEAVKIVLEFLYTDRIMSLEGRENELETVKLIVDVYKLANQFLIPRLKKMCESFIESSITCSNVLNILRYVDLLNLQGLKESCMKFLSKDSNFNEVILLTEFEQLQPALIVEIVRLRQVPKKSQINDQLNEMILEKCTTLKQDFESFLKNEIGNEFADILIYFNEQSPPLLGHKCILAARCAYFEAYFRSFMPKDRKVLMTIGDTVPPRQACMSLLRYIYYDDVAMPPQDALYLISASHYFQFSNLRLYIFCKQNLEANVSKENVFDILEVSDKIKDDKMKNFALTIIRANFRELSDTSRIGKLSKELLLDILRDVGKVFPVNAHSNIQPANNLNNVSSGGSASPTTVNTLNSLHSLHSHQTYQLQAPSGASHANLNLSSYGQASITSSSSSGILNNQTNAGSNSANAAHAPVSPSLNSSSQLHNMFTIYVPGANQNDENQK